MFAIIKTISQTTDYNKYLNDLNSLVPEITDFFNNVLVMDEDENVKNNRLAMLTILKDNFEKLCDFSKIQN